MIEKRVRDYLSAHTDLPVYTEIEANMPQRYYILEKTGGSKRDHVARATMAIRSYGASLADASELNAQLKAMMELLPTNEEVSKVTLNSDYNNTDTRTRAYRYQAVFDIVYYD